MNIEEAKALFKEKYSVPWIELVDEHQEELFFKIGSDQMRRASADELRAYAMFEERRSEFSASPVECCMCSKEYREQMISLANQFKAPYHEFRGTPMTFGDPASGALYVEVGEASDDFKNYFRFADGFHEYSSNRIRRRGSGRPTSSDTLWDSLFSPLTVRIYNIRASDIQQAIKKSQSIIEGCLFNLTYLKGVVYSLDEQWPRFQPRQRPFQFEERKADRDLPLPKGRLNTDIIRFYQRGMSTDDPVNQFLSFYQVLEYFFVSISDEELYRKLAAIVNDPAFSAKPKQLDRIIQETTSHKRESDETEMLRLVLSRYVDESELIRFIEAYEEYLGEKWYSKKRRLFGDENEVRAVPGHIVGNVAKRVKMVRNALVHSSDRYNRQETFIPTPNSEASVKKEVPLVKYLAEKVIIANSYERP
ncbi:MAG: hypothetical protein KKA54_07735 [Proteobacteria bacterium]|nr:hypothetical protein [Pseudomonadota bacterium]MBU0966256.1 hypothetical protein [Pseudomonadota bacterium]